MIYLVLVQRAVAGRGGQHKLTDKLDLGLEVIIGETAIQLGIHVAIEIGIRMVIPMGI